MLRISVITKVTVIFVICVIIVTNFGWRSQQPGNAVFRITRLVHIGSHIFPYEMLIIHIMLTQLRLLRDMNQSKKVSVELVLWLEI